MSEISMSQVQELIRKECNAIGDMLVAKNKAYGNSAIEPERVFSKADPIEQLNVRMDDKLSRIKKGESAGEDPEFDLIGYLILKRVAKKVLNGKEGKAGLTNFVEKAAGHE